MHLHGVSGTRTGCSSDLFGVQRQKSLDCGIISGNKFFAFFVRSTDSEHPIDDDDVVSEENEPEEIIARPTAPNWGGEDGAATFECGSRHDRSQSGYEQGLC